MNAKFRNIFIIVVMLVIAVTLAACHGSSNDNGATTTSSQPTTTTAPTQLTTGVITGFGSVFVNGIEFQRRVDIDPAKATTFKFDDTLHPEGDLRVGMIVTIKGTIDDAAKKGEFEAIEFQPEIRGPLDNLGVDLVNDKLKIMGRDIIVDASTVFDGLRDLNELESELTASHHPELEISGTMDNSGAFHATRIAKKADDFSGGKVELQGTIAASPAPTTSGFSVGNISVVVTGTTVFADMTASDIAAGLLVEVRGALSGSTLTAVRIGKKSGVSEGIEVNDNVRIEGLAAGPIAGGSFTLNGPNGPVTVKVDGATVYLQGGSAADSTIVAANAKLEVEGSLQADLSILATKISIELEKTVKLEGDLEAGAAVDTTAGTIKLNGVTAKIGSLTRLIDSKSGVLYTSLAAFNLVVGEHLQIAGSVDAAGAVTASQVQRTPAPKKTVRFIQGPVSGIDVAGSTFTILGITVDTSLTSEFHVNTAGVNAGTTKADFFAQLSVGVIVKAKGTVSGTSLPADEVEIEK